ncbi:MAG: hypothetical protein P4L61_00170, partial [Candidatus Pacebacteria bacterium]|nr:hypothetical protein [Candidatus Paceibacterota bacterium]
LLIAGAILHRFGPGLVKEFLSNEKLAKASMFFKDTLDHMDYLDNLQGKSGQGIGRDILLHMGAAAQNNFGVEFKDQETKALSLRLLKEAIISPIEALTGSVVTNRTPERQAAAQVFAGLTPEQRRVIAEHYLNGKTLASKVRAYAKDLETFVADPTNKVHDNGILRDAQAALGFVQQAFQPQSKIRTDIDNMLGHSLSNAMDFYFFANPKFHLLNLSDMWISGAARVGPLNIARANILLAADKTLRAAFGHSNLTGSFAAERATAAASAGKKNFKLPDFQSDKINADRVILASFLDFFDKNPRAMSALGITDRADFARRLVSGDIQKMDPSITAKAWAHAADVGSRTLGIDPFRVNTDIVSRSINSPAFGVFGKQPARFARNAISYLANGDMRGLITQLASTAVLGGRAAMPLEIRAAWAAVDPDAEFQAEKDLDRLNIARLLTHQDASSKLDYSLFYPVQTVISPGYAAMKNIPEAG